MAINWQSLTPIQAPQVQGTIAASPASGGMNDLAGGIMQGMQQGQQMGLNAQQMKLNDQALDFNAKNNPLVLEQNQQKVETGRMDQQERQQKMAAIEAFKANSDQGYQKAAEAMTKIDPAGGIKMQQDLQDLQFKQGQAAEQMAKGRKEQLSTLHEIQITGGEMAATATSMATDPQTGQVDWNKANAAYKQMMEPLIKTAPDIASLYPPTLDQGSAMNLQKIGADAMYNKVQYELAKNPGTSAPSDTTKRIGEINQSRIAAGQAPLTPKERAAIQEKALDKSIAPTQMFEDPVDKVIAERKTAGVKEYAEAAKDSDSIISLAETFRAANKNYKTGYGSEVKLKLQQIYETVTGEKLPDTASGEALQSLSMDFVMKRIAGTKGAISEKEMSAFQKASPGFVNSEAGNEAILNMLVVTELRKKERSAMADEYLEKNRTMKGFDAEWKKYIDENPALDPKTFKIINPKYQSQSQPQKEQAPTNSSNANNDPLGLR